MQKFQIKNMMEIKKIEKMVSKCPETMISYLAGYFDGEGSLTINGRKRFDRYHGGPRIRSRVPVLNIKIGTTERHVLDLFRKYFGGKVHVNRRKTKTGNMNYYYRAGVNSTKVILKHLFPYLTIKKEQSELALEMFRKSDSISWKEFMPEKIRLLRKIRSFNKKIGDMAVEIKD